MSKEDGGGKANCPTGARILDIQVQDEIHNELDNITNTTTQHVPQVLRGFDIAH